MFNSYAVKSENIKIFLKTEHENKQFLQIKIFTWINFYIHNVSFHIKCMKRYEGRLKDFIHNLEINTEQQILQAKQKCDFNSKEINTCDKLLFLFFFSELIIQLYENRCKSYMERIQNYHKNILNYNSTIEKMADGLKLYLEKYKL